MALPNALVCGSEDRHTPYDFVRSRAGIASLYIQTHENAIFRSLRIDMFITVLYFAVCLVNVFNGMSRCLMSEVTEKCKWCYFNEWNTYLVWSPLSGVFIFARMINL